MGGGRTQEKEKVGNLPLKYREDYYAASLWAFLFALICFYWALGGLLCVDTLGIRAEVAADLKNPRFYFELWASGLLKALLGLLPLALVRGWFRNISPRWLYVLTGLSGAGLAIFYLGSLARLILVKNGAVPFPPELGTNSLLTQIYCWNPWGILGSILFLQAAWRFRQAQSAAAASISEPGVRSET